ncbi:MAG: aspartate-semialdehyde dehydrogenase [Phycisphaerales bacterium]
MASSQTHPRVAIVGATGAVGREMLTLLEERAFPLESLRLLASSRSAGAEIPFRGQSLTVEELGERSFENIDLALFSAGSGVSKQFAPLAVEQGAVVVDNSSAFRMDDDKALVVPEINGDEIDRVRERGPAIIANPNCSTIIMLMAVTPLRAAFGLKRAVVATYQAASGAGAAAMEELRTQTREALDDQPLTMRVFDQPYAFNLFSHNSDIGPDGYNTEERKLVLESRKIWGDPSVRIAATCVRVPVLRAHSEAINLTLASPVDEATARRALAEAPGVEIVDDRKGNRFPTPLLASGRDPVLVGRLRLDPSQTDDNGACHGLELFAAGDQIRKGAALNAIQIAERWFDFDA